MPYAVREFACAGCGRPTWRRAAADAQVRCINCSIERAVENMHQLRAKRGAFYDKWAARTAEAVAIEVKRAADNKAAERAG